MHRQDDGGVALQFGGDGSHGIQSTRCGCQKRGGNVKAGVARQNPSVEETGQKNENHGEGKDNKMLG